MIIRQNNSADEWRQAIQQCPSDTVIGEFAGRDSVAAILKLLEEGDITSILPVVTFAPVEYGSVDVLEANVNLLRQQVMTRYQGKVSIEPLMYLSNQALWQVLNSSFVSILQQHFGFYTPCIGCHAYFHLMRMPLAKRLGGRVISGERESHDGRLKANQLGICLDSYQRIMAHFGVDLLIPLRQVTNGKEIEALIQWQWEEGKAQPQCLFSGNDRNKRGESLINEQLIPSYLETFLEPVCINLGHLLLENPQASLAEMKEVVIERLTMEGIL